MAAPRRQVADTASDLDHWLDRASGRVSADDPGWYFTGRRELTTTVADFLHRADGMLLVTGVAGTGKSAVITRNKDRWLGWPKTAGDIQSASW
ncbi:MAG: hypothetical protein ACRDRS_02070 [Pseudonocardiaceae bacterium]